MKFNRILLKLSGEALMGQKNFGIDSTLLEKYSQEIKEIHKKGIEIAIVIGGGIYIEVLNLKNLELIEFKVIIWEC